MDNFIYLVGLTTLLLAALIGFISLHAYLSSEFRVWRLTKRVNAKYQYLLLLHWEEVKELLDELE